MKTFFAKLAERSPIVIFGDRLYQPTAGDADDNYIKVGNHKFELVPACDLNELEKFDSELNAQDIFNFKKKFIEDKLHQEIKSADELKNFIGKNELVAFIVYKVFPLFMEDPNELEAMVLGKDYDASASKNIAKVIEGDAGAKVTEDEINALKYELIAEIAGEKEKGHVLEEATDKDFDIGTRVKQISTGELGSIVRCADNNHYSVWMDKLKKVVTVTKRELVKLVPGRKLGDIQIGDKVEITGSGNTYAATKDGSWGYVTKITGAEIEIEFRKITGGPNAPRYAPVKKEHVCRIADSGKKPQIVQDDNDLEEMLTEYYGKKFPQKTRQPKEDVKIPLPKNTTGLGEILHGNPIFTFKEGVYKLVPQCAEFKMVKEEWVSDDFEIVINKQKYDLEPLATAKDIEAAFAQSLVRKFKIAAVQEFESQLVEMQKARTRHKALEKCVDKDTFEVENVGFIKHGGQYYVYLKLPKFAMKHPTREEYYAFEPCRVGVCVNYQNGKVHVSNNEPVVIDNYSHPFIPSDGPAFQTICSPSRRKMSGVDIRGLSDEEAIAKVLRHAQNVIMNGLTVESFHSHGGKDIDDTSYYGTTLKNRLRDRIISREQVVKGGYLITNLHQYTQNRR